MAYWTDTHAMGKTPVFRKDNIVDTLDMKMTEIVDTSNEENADFALHGGDLYHREDVAPSVATRMNEHLDRFNCPVGSIIGSHDMDSYSKDLSRVLIGVAESAGAFIHIKFDSPMRFTGEDGAIITLTGADADAEFDYNSNIADYCPEKPKDSDCHIHVCHSMLWHKKLPEGVPCTLIDDIVEHTQADIILSGHIHGGFGPIIRYNAKGEKKIFFNPGSVLRVDRSKAERTRAIKMGFVRVTKEDFWVDPYVLKTPRSGDDVLDLEALEAEIEKKNKQDEFMAKLAGDDLEAFRSINIYDALEGVGKRQKVEPRIITMAKDAVIEAEGQIRGSVDSHLEQI